MVNNDIIDDILNNLINNGSNIPYLKELREKSIDEISKDRSLSDTLKSISSDIEVLTKAFLEKKNEYDTNYITGISTGIYLPDYDYGNYRYTVIGGNTFRDLDEKVNFDTKFDIASITKLYTLILAFKLEELGLIDLNARVKDINPDFQKLNDFTLNDLIRLHGELRTDGNIATANSIEEAQERFKTLYLVSSDRTRNKYTDFGAMVIADTIEKVVSKEFHKDMRFNEIMNEFLFKPLLINNTMFTPGIINVSGNANHIGMPHDPKSRNLGGITGHAGLFTNSEELMKLADGIFKEELLDKNHIDRISERTFDESCKGNLGVYLKHPEGFNKTYNPSEFSNKSFSHQGWTGSVVSFDPKNKIHDSILVNAILKSDDKEKIMNDKPKGFKNTFGLYQSELIKRIMLLYVIKKYYNKYCNIKENIEEKRLII